ncbi:hypothetical protein [Altericista sp. CCNU0014]|uniref:hypothetical protein n=1 Tax=Altericista sp. CCNU0014 TaxID=3082949 RepID=UPI00384AB766
MLTPQTRKWVLLLGIAFISLGSLSVVESLDLNLTLKLYGLLATCQIGFLLFFLSRIPLNKTFFKIVRELGR